MSADTNLLDKVQIASPCEMPWEQMRGNERVRWCAQCGLSVYNLSDMTRTKAEELILRTEGRLCARFYRRDDGTTITKDCPVGVWKAARRRTFSVFATIGIAGYIGAVVDNPIADAMRQVEPFATIMNWFFPRPAPGQYFLGMVDSSLSGNQSKQNK